MARWVGVLVGAAIVLLSSGAAAASPRDRVGPPTVLRTFTGQAGSTYGGAVSDLADIDRDGAKDAIIGAPGFTDASGVVGLVEVRSGRTGQLRYKLHGQPGDRFGYSLADAGDVDGDRVHDIVVGAPGVARLACVDSTSAGRALVYSGATGRLVRTYSGTQAAAQFGAAVAAAGDVDRDGHGDLLVGAPCTDTANGADTGAAYVVSGATGRVLRTHLGSQPGDGFGWGTGALPDPRGGVDGYVVGAKDGGTDDRGEAVVYDARRGMARFTVRGDGQSSDFGWFFVASAGDADGDHITDVYVGDFCGADATDSCTAPRGQAYVFSGRNGRLLWQFTGAAENDGAGPGRSAGDVDRDGYGDIVVGSYLSSAAVPFGGRVVVYSGRTGRVLADYAGPKEGELIGFDAVGLGDVDRDGHADLLVSAAGGDAVYVLRL